MAKKMSSLHPISKKSYRGNVKSKRGAEEGRLYEKLSLAFLAKRGYELSKQDNSEFCEFSIGREVGIGKEAKFDDVVFSYIDQNKTKKLIFVQIKHKLDDGLIDSRVLSIEASRARNEGGSHGGMGRDFNLQKYFISYLSARDELQNTKSKELLNGKIKYVALYTNIGLDTEELNENGFSLKIAPDDIVNLFTIGKPTSETQSSIHCYQLENVNEGVRKMLENSSDLRRLAKELAQYVVWKHYREKRTMGIDEAPMKHYHVALEREVIQKSDQTKDKSPGKRVRNEPYCEARFRDDFLDSDEPSSKQKLRNALFEAIRELDESRKDANDDELKRVLREAKWKVVSNFGKNKQNIETELPREWITVKDEDITDFLKCLVFIVEQPRVTELETLYKRSIQGIVAENALLKQFLEKIEDTDSEFRNCVEKVFGIDIKTNTEEKWISGNKIQNFIEKRKQLVSITFVVTAMTLMFKNEILQYGKFTDLGKVTEYVDIFLTSNCKILFVNTPVTLLSSIKILQHLNTGQDCDAENDRIFVNLDMLNCAENRDSVLKAFDLETNSLLAIECRHAFKHQDVEQFFFELLNIAKSNSDKKLVLITQPENSVTLMENMKNDFQDETQYVLKHDSIDLKDFKPIADPLVKDVIVFQGQKVKISLSDLTGIDNWSSYVNNLSVETNGQGIIDGMTLLEILNKDAIEVGSKPPGTSSLDGAYAKIYEEINVETLAKKCVSLEHTNNTKDIYIISGICGLSKQEKAEKIIQCLGLSENKEKIQEQVGDIGSDKKMQIADDQFQDEDFQSLCHNSPDKRIFWICVKWENNATKFMLQEIYNPRFYLKRKFKNVIIKKDLKKHLLKEYLSETFIFHCVEGKRGLYNFMELNEHETKQFEGNCKIKIFSLKSDAEAVFKVLSKKNETVHLLDLEKNQLVWWDSHGSLCKLWMYIDHKESKRSLVEEDKLIRKIKDRKVVVLADDPGMGKSTTVIKLYETESESSSIKNSHWVIVIKLTNCLKAVRDVELRKNGIDIVSVIEFLSKIDSKLHNTLAKKLLAIALDKGKYFPKSLLLIFDGLDEILDDDDRKRIIMLLQFIKNGTAATLWITTRLHQKESLERELSTIAIAFVPMDNPQKIEYITMYLQHRLYLILNEEKYTKLFDKNDEVQDNGGIHVYTVAFLNKMESIFSGDLARFIGTPLQLYLMLGNSVGHFKIWLEDENAQNSDFNYMGNDIVEVYEKFVARKYGVYFQKIGIRERIQKIQEIISLDQYHKEFAKLKILELTLKKSLKEFLDKILLVGLIISEGNEPQFIHKTFEEFFAAKVFIYWIKKGSIKFSNTNKQEYLFKMILTRPGYELVRTFFNLQLEKITEKARKDEIDESQKHCGNIVAKLFNEKEWPLSIEYGSPLLTAVKEGNKAIANFLLKGLKGHRDVLKKFLFIPHERVFTALHLACKTGNVRIVKILLEAAKGISEDALQEFLQFDKGSSALVEAITGCKSNTIHTVEILKELLRGAKSKLDVILTRESALCKACIDGKEEFVEVLLQELKHDKRSLRELLLYYDVYGNALCYARSSTTAEMLLSAAKSMNDSNETLKKLLFPSVILFPDHLPFYNAVSRGRIDVVKKLINVAKEMDDENHTLKQLLLNETYGISSLYYAAEYGFGDIIKLLLKTAADLGIEMLEKLIIGVDSNGKNAIQSMIENGYVTIFADSFKMLEEDKYQNIRKKVMDMYDNVPLESTLYSSQEILITAIDCCDNKLVKDILSNAKHSSDRPNEKLRILLLTDDEQGVNILWNACAQSNLEIIKELLSYAVNIDDGGAVLKELLTKPFSSSRRIFEAIKDTYASVINPIVDILILDAKNNNKGNVVNILEEIKYMPGDEVARVISILWEACEQRNSENIKEFISHAVNDDDDDGGLILKVLTKPSSNSRILFETIQNSYASVINQIVDILILEAKSNNEDNVVSKLDEIKNTFGGECEECISFLWEACEQGNSEDIKKLLSYAVSGDDEEVILKELTKPSSNSRIILEANKNRYASVINPIIDILILEARNNNEDNVVNKLEEIKNAFVSKGEQDISILWEAYEQRNSEDIKELLSHAVSSDDEGPILKVLTTPSSNSRIIFETIKNRYATIFNPIVDILILEAKNNNEDDVVNKLEKMKNTFVGEGEQGISILWEACEQGNSENIKELLSYAVRGDNGGPILKVLTKPSSISRIILERIKNRYANVIHPIVDILILEARNNNEDNVVNKLEEIKNMLCGKG